MNPSPLVSVLGVTYNHEKFIGEFIESVLSQTHRNLELVIADDGSTDGTPDIIRRYASRDPRIKPIMGAQNQGLPVNFNRAVVECRGEFIAILSADDVMMPEKIEAQVRFFSEHEDCGGLSHDSLVIDEKGAVLYQWSGRHKPITGHVECLFGTNWSLQKDHRPAPPSFMFRRSFMQGTSYDLRLPNCNEWLHPVDCSMQRPDLKWCYLPRVLSKYRRHERQTSRDPEVGKSNFEERMSAIAIVSSKYPQIRPLIDPYKAYTQFQFLLFNWHPPALMSRYERQFLKEAGPMKWLYFRFCRYYLGHRRLFDGTAFLRKWAKRAKRFKEAG